MDLAVEKRHVLGVIEEHCLGTAPMVRIDVLDYDVVGLLDDDRGRKGVSGIEGTCSMDLKSLDNPVRASNPDEGIVGEAILRCLDHDMFAWDRHEPDGSGGIPVCRSQTSVDGGNAVLG